MLLQLKNTVIIGGTNGIRLSAVSTFVTDGAKLVFVGKSVHNCTQAIALHSYSVGTACVTNAALQHKANDVKKFCAGLAVWGQFRSRAASRQINYPPAFQQSKLNGLLTWESFFKVFNKIRIGVFL